jgi:hypothetical protein
MALRTIVRTSSQLVVDVRDDRVEGQVVLPPVRGAQ